MKELYIALIISFLFALIAIIKDWKNSSAIFYKKENLVGVAVFILALAVINVNQRIPKLELISGRPMSYSASILGDLELYLENYPTSPIS